MYMDHDELERCLRDVRKARDELAKQRDHYRSIAEQTRAQLDQVIAERNAMAGEWSDEMKLKAELAKVTVERDELKRRLNTLVARRAHAAARARAQLVEGRWVVTPVRIYVASSWRNPYQPGVVATLREAGFDVYDFRNPGPGDNGFGWREIDPDWERWDVERYRDALTHPIAERGFGNDMRGMESSDHCCLVLPCGRSAHLEAGWFAGRGRPLSVYAPVAIEPELMYKLAEPRFAICTSTDEVIAFHRSMAVPR